MPGRTVALLRGINLGKAKRIAMAELRAVVEGLGYGDVKTLLNSGNVVFNTPADRAKLDPLIDREWTTDALAELVDDDEAPRPCRGKLKRHALRRVVNRFAPAGV